MKAKSCLFALFTVTRDHSAGGSRQPYETLHVQGSAGWRTSSSYLYFYHFAIGSIYSTSYTAFKLAGKTLRIYGCSFKLS